MQLSPPLLLPLGVVSGTAQLSHADPGWTLLDRPDRAQEPERRVCETRIEFERRFTVAPIVQAGLAGLDIDNGANARVSVRAVNIGCEGFTIRAETWFNTRIWMVEVNWLAIGHFE